MPESERDIAKGALKFISDANALVKRNTVAESMYGKKYRELRLWEKWAVNKAVKNQNKAAS